MIYGHGKARRKRRGDEGELGGVKGACLRCGPRARRLRRDDSKVGKRDGNSRQSAD
jgi:hypothetical protein